MLDPYLLTGVPHVSDIPISQAQLLTEAMTLIEGEDGHLFLAEGSARGPIFIVIEGEVVASTTVSGSCQELRRLGAGDLFGLLSAIDNAPTMASYRAHGPARVAKLERARFYELSERSEAIDLAFARAIASQLARDFRDANARVQALVAEDRAGAPTTGADPAASPDELDYDVIVMGAGPLGIGYAQWLARERPQTRIAIIERKRSPGHKVGESTLSATTNAFLSLGLAPPVLRRLFANKVGIRFWQTDTNTNQLRRHIDLIDIEETFQVERRVLEIALQETSRRMGIELFTGTRVDIKATKLDGPINEVVVIGPDDQPRTLRCKVFCDASGPACVLARHRGIHRAEPERFDTFNTNSYFGYFRQRENVPIKHFQEAATRHICFPQGWTWFITLNSWEAASDEQIHDMVVELLDHPEGHDHCYPTRQDFARRMGIETERVVSIGLTVRDDLDSAKHLPIQERFNHYLERYPALGWVLDHFELIEHPYEDKRRPFFAYLGLAYDCTQPAGDGWCIIGDAAQFSNPLFSHGMNYGTGTAWVAAKCTREALDRGDVSQASFAAYTKHCAELYPALLHETDFFYRSFRHPDSFEQAWLAKMCWAALDIADRPYGYCEADTLTHKPLEPRWREMIERVRVLQRDGERDGLDPAEIARLVCEIMVPFNDSLFEQGKDQSIPLAPLLSHYTPEGRRVEEKDKARGTFRAYQCPNKSCHLWVDDRLAACYNCGTANPARHDQLEFMSPGATKAVMSMAGGMAEKKTPVARS